MTEYHMDCPRAIERLLRLGVPATVINPMQVGRSPAHTLLKEDCIRHVPC